MGLVNGERCMVNGEQSSEKGMSQAALGRALGLSPAAITKLKGQGMPVDSVAAAQAWREARQNVAQRKPAPAATVFEPGQPPRVEFHGQPVFGGASVDLLPGEDRDEARTRREIAEANLAELQLEKLRGDVRDVVDISRGVFDIARELRDAMDSSVNTMAADMAQLDSADACAKALRLYNRTIQEGLAKSLREKLAVKVAAE